MRIFLCKFSRTITGLVLQNFEIKETFDARCITKKHFQAESPQLVLISRNTIRIVLKFPIDSSKDSINDRRANVPYDIMTTPSTSIDEEDFNIVDYDDNVMPPLIEDFTGVGDAFFASTVIFCGG